MFGFFPLVDHHGFHFIGKLTFRFWVAIKNIAELWPGVFFRTHAEVVIHVGLIGVCTFPLQGCAVYLLQAVLICEHN